MMVPQTLAQLRQQTVETYQNALIPHELFVALQQDICSSELCVHVGDIVSEGQVLAKEKNNLCAIHAPVSGTITRLVELPLANGKNGLALAIRMAGSLRYIGKVRNKQQWDYLSREQLLTNIAEKGVVNTFYKPFPLALELKKLCAQNADRNIIIRLFDADPTCITDSFIASHFLPEILDGISAIAAICNPAAVYCVHDKRVNLGGFGVAMNGLFNALPIHFIPVDTELYPKGTRHELFKAIKKVAKQAITVELSKNDLLLDASTAYSAYEAVLLDMPCMSRFVTICGDALEEARVFKALIGTPLYALLEECTPLLCKPGEIVVNGNIAGNSVHSLEVPVTKYVKSFAIMKKQRSTEYTQAMCIRCGKCRAVCPKHLHPDELYNQFCRHAKITLRDAQVATLCADCRLCNLVCPSRLPLNQGIVHIKAEYLRKAKKDKK